MLVVRPNCFSFLFARFSFFFFGGHALLHRLHRFISCAWNSQQLPQQWKDANIITIYKRKGDRAECRPLAKS